MKLPVDAKWKIDQSRKRGLALLATKNMHFDDEGFATLANRTITVFNEDNDANFRTPVAVYQNPDVGKIAGVNNSPYSVDINDSQPSITADGLSNQPSLSFNTSQAYFNNKWFVSETGDLNSYSGSAWTDEVVSLTSGVRHPLCVHKGNNSLMVGNGASIKQYNTSISETTNLTIPAGVEVVAIAYNRNFACAVTWDANGREAWLYIWDGGTAAANYAYPIGSNRAYFVAAYKDTFVTLTALGQLLYWDPAGMKELAALPSFYTTAVLGDTDNRSDVCVDTSVMVDGERILFNINTLCSFKNSELDRYNPQMPTGIWCYDPVVGLYHRHAPSGAKLLRLSATTANVVPATDVITVSSGTVPATGTPFTYVSVDDLPIGGLTQNHTYFVIKTGATTFKVASTRANAAAGTAIDLTSSTSALSYDFLFWPESDFGQIGIDATAGIITFSGPGSSNASNSFFTLFSKYVFGFSDVCRNSVADAQDLFGMVMDRGENRGYIITQWMYSSNVKDRFQKLFVKARHLLTEDDKVLVKWRVEEDLSMPIIARSSTTKGTWVSSTQFTTAADLSAAKTAFDAGKKYEIEFITGAGAGYLAHISGISLNAGTYTVDIDDAVRNVAAADTCYFVIDNWLRALPKDGSEGSLYTSNGDFVEFPLGKGSKKMQLKIEVRGYLVQLEELEIVNSGEQAAL